MENLIGLSLSKCIKDVIDGLVKTEDIKCIIARTRIRNTPELVGVVDSYCKLWWKKDPVLGRYLAYMFWDTGKIIQPRLQSDGGGVAVELYCAEDEDTGHWAQIFKF
jgi:hypothetical protein